MKTKRELYTAVYHIEDADKLSDKQMNEFLMCGDSNWDYFFVNLVDDLKDGYEKIENVELIEFESNEDMFELLRKTDEKFVIDYSTAHDKPCILKFLK